MSLQVDDLGADSATKGTPRSSQSPGRPLVLASWLAGVFWYAVGLWAAFAILARVVAPAWQTAGTDIVGLAIRGQAVLGMVLLAIGFVLVHLGWRAAWQWTRVAGSGSPPSAPGRGFPTPPTLQIGVGVFSFAALSLAAVVAMLHFGVESVTRQAILMTCAAGVGSSIATILGFLEHASEKEDFNPAFAPWFVGRPVMGLLLGLTFFLVIRGGMLGVLPNFDKVSLNPYGLAAIGAMVGLFTKHAVEKLQEVFDVLFQTKNDMQKDLLARLPADLKKQVEPYLAPEKAPDKGTQTTPQDGPVLGGSAKGDAPASGTTGTASATPNDTAKTEPSGKNE